MFHVKYRDSFGKLIVLEGRTEFEDAESEAEDHGQLGTTRWRSSSILTRSTLTWRRPRPSPVAIPF